MRLVVGVWWVIPAVASLELALLQSKQPYGPKMCALLCEGSSELLCSFSATELSCKVFRKARAVVAAAANSSSELNRTLIQQTREVTTVRRNNFRTRGRRRIKKKVRIKVFSSGDGKINFNQHFEKRTWDAALRICQSEGGSLIKINTHEKENTITHNMEKHFFGRDYVWIGLRDITDTNTFVWTDNSSLTYHHWGEGQPSNFSKGRAGTHPEDCVALVSQKFFGVQWEDRSCSVKNKFLCETIE